MESNLEQSSNDSVDVTTVDSSTSDVNIENTKNIREAVNNDLDPSLTIPKIDYEAIGEFCFESDILALKGNQDYKNILEALVILEAQKEQAIKDRDTLIKIKEEAIADPFGFVERLKKKENMNFPSAQKIHPVPSIDWGKYALSGDPAAFRRRQLSKIATDIKRAKRKLHSAKENETEMWCTEEENQLEELLKKFPPEENQLERWKKIANSLKSRTASQVADKAQKCFPKLIGNNTFSAEISTEVGVLRRNSQQLENDEESNYQESVKTDEDSLDSKIDVSDDEEIDSRLHDTPEYQELLLLKRVLKKKLKLSTMSQHLGFKCAWCKSQPIVGIRYHCVDCKPESVDFCEECVGGGYDLDQHMSDHQLEEIHHTSTGFLDRDYMHFLGNDYNYLDPNYMPAT